jgi:hypothetical protein
MNKIRDVLQRARLLVVAATFALAGLIAAVPMQDASAGSLTTRSLMVSSTAPGNDTTDSAGVDVSATPGHPNNGSKVTHIYTFTPYTTATTIKAFRLSYCDAPFGYLNIQAGSPTACTNPTNFSASAWGASSPSVTIGGQSFAVTYDNTLKTLKFTNATGISAAGPITITMTATATNYFRNPDSSYANKTYFAHIETFNDNTTVNNTTRVDEGTVTNNITTSININTRVQETLNFSVEGDQGTANTPSSTYTTGACPALTDSGVLNMGDTNNALSSSTAYFTKSFFRIATNSAHGAKVYYAGHTLTSGASDTITAIGTAAAASSPGSEQFGFAFDTTATGDAHLIGSGGGTAGDMTPVAAYATSGTGYAYDASSFTTPVLLASSAGVVRCDTGSLKYVANISNDTEAGVYTTKINFISSPSY